MTSHISDIVYGGIDGTITTFAVMASALGTGITGLTVAILAMANMLADGFSMGVSSYESVVDENEDPLIKGITTFLSFAVIGMIPIIAYYMVRDSDYDIQFSITIIASLLTLFLIGLFKGYSSNHESILQSGLKTMVLGGIAGSIAYYVSTSLSKINK